MRKRILRVRLL